VQKTVLMPVQLAFSVCFSVILCSVHCVFTVFCCHELCLAVLCYVSCTFCVQFSQFHVTEMFSVFMLVPPLGWCQRRHSVCDCPSLFLSSGHRVVVENVEMDWRSASQCRPTHDYYEKYVERVYSLWTWNVCTDAGVTIASSTRGQHAERRARRGSEHDRFWPCTWHSGSVTARWGIRRGWRRRQRWTRSPAGPVRQPITLRTHTHARTQMSIDCVTCIVTFTSAVRGRRQSL